MTLIDARKLHIFVPNQSPFDENWVEQTLGAIVRPLKQEYKTALRWIWINRYCYDYVNERTVFGHSLDTRYISNDNKYRFVALRVNVINRKKQSFENDALQRVQDSDCHVDANGWMPCNIEKELGNDRFIHKDANRDERRRRALLIVSFMDTVANLMIDSLIQNSDGKWILETNADKNNNPKCSFLESVHHLFCNATEVPTDAILSLQDEHLIITTWHAKSLNIWEDIQLNDIPRRGEPEREVKLIY